MNGFLNGKYISMNSVRSQTTLSITKLKLSPQEGSHRLEREKWFEDLRQIKNLKIKVFYSRFLFLKKGFHTSMDQGKLLFCIVEIHIVFMYRIESLMAFSLCSAKFSINWYQRMVLNSDA